MPDPIDLRSDTVTKPSPAMRAAMARAEVGDDVFGDDPTVNALEARAAELTGKPAAVFVASGTMGNLVSHLAHVPRGGEIIADAGAHLVQMEAGGYAVISGATVRALAAGPDGTWDLDVLRASFRPDDDHQPRTELVTIENTHSPTMGRPLSGEYTSAVAAVAHEHGVPLHVDGARLWNSVVAQGTTARALLADVDSATFCLSKGLGCPVGSVVVGEPGFIARARRGRKLVGGAMRQAGIVAAAGLVALSDGSEGMIERLADDHANARTLAEGLAQMDGIVGLDPDDVTTNYLVFGVRPRPGQEPLEARDAFMAETTRRGLTYIGYPGARVRALTHYGIGAADIERALSITREALTAADLAVVVV
ncbi:MAG: GntG family PLP-dependent aldolase [Candidatus Limnocylindrales bacterium]